MSPPSVATPQPAPPAAAEAPLLAHGRLTMLLLNVAHAIDHLVLLIFATAVGAIAADFGFARWEDLMPYAAGAFLMFGLGSVPAGRFGDHWGRRSMMLVFLFGTGAACLLAAVTQSAWQLAAVLTLLGAFASIYHPVGIPMLVQGATRPGRIIGVNGLAGNLGIAVAAVLTGITVKFLGWRMAFVIPGLALPRLRLGVRARTSRSEDAPPARRAPKLSDLPRREIAQVVLILTITSTCSSLVFNFLTNGNGELMTDRLREVTANPAAIGGLLGLVYVIASFAQLDRRARDRPLSAEAAVPRDHADAGAAVRARCASPTAGCSTRSRSPSWRSCSAPFRSPTRSSCATSTTACARASPASASPSHSASRRPRCGCWGRS